MRPSAARWLYPGLDLLAVLVTALTLALVVFSISVREYALTGQALVFFSFLGLASIGVVATRFHLTGGLLCLALIVSVDQIDQVKFAATLTRLHPSDLFIAINFLNDLDYSLLVQYSRELRVLYWGLGLMIVALPLLWYHERTTARKLRFWRVPPGSLVAAVFATCAFTVALINSRYFEALAQFPDADLQWAHKGLRVSSVVLQTLKLNKIDREINHLLTEAKRAGPSAPSDASTVATCEPGGCPDIIFIHLESVFDPVLLAEYHDTRGYLDRMDELKSPASRSGGLRVHAWGGGSWVSEFAILCGVDPNVFGQAGLMPHVTLSPYVRHCLPNYLKRLGYETHAIYTSTWNFAGAGPGFKRYGIDNFIDVRKIKAPTDWQSQRDRHFVGEARSILEKPSKQPRFIFVSTNWNHGPHGHGRDHTVFRGPFDIKKGGDPSVQDYINRLNDTFTEMAALERDLMQTGRRVALLFYGDHHPSFPKRFAASRSADPKVGPDNLTLYRLARSYEATGPRARTSLWIEELSERFLEFAGVPRPPTMVMIRALREQCGNSDIRCPPRIRNAIGAALLEE